MRHLLIALLLVSPAALHAADSQSAPSGDGLERAFVTPPDSAKPLTWWHWLDGNITREGITGDLEAMKQAGLGGAYLFNCGVGMPQGEVRFMQPRWLEMMDHTVHEAERLGLKFGVHNCDGFSQSGGPWMNAETSMKELTWTATDAPGGTLFDAVLAQPVAKEDFYRDIAVIAFPLPQGERLTGPGTETTLRGTLKPAELDKLADGKPQTKAEFPAAADANTVEFVFAKPRTVRSVVCHNAAPHRWEEDFPIQMEVSDDGARFRPVGSFTANWDMIGGGAITAACEEATGKVFRLRFSNPWPVSIGEIELSETARVHFAEAKATRLRSRGHGAERRHHDAYPGPDRGRALANELVVARGAVANLTALMDKDGRLKWQAPPGRWRILRVGFTSNGHRVSPATPEGRGLECDKLDPKAVRFHLEQYVGKLLQRVGPAAGKTFAAMEVDSWECGIQNWTAGFERRFRERVGYDLLPFLPALLEGWIVDSADVSERALWDWRRFLSDQFSESYLGVVARFAGEKGLTYVGESTGRQQFLYDVASMRNCAVPMGEFWNDRGTGQGVRVDNKVASSIAHTAGRPVIAAEAYTSGGDAAGWNNHPFSMKPLGDRAFCAGVNQFVFHTFAHQPYRATGPGFTFASWGLNFNRANTWWAPGRAWMEYLTRCNHLLREGRPAADVLFFVGEDVPNRIAWRDELRPILPPGYDFDGCDARTVMDARVENGRIVLPSGTQYRVLLLPNLPTMRPAILKKVRELVAAGAVALGPRPKQSPSLRDAGDGDQTVRQLAEELWGGAGGRVSSGVTFEDLFKRIGLAPDFEWRASSPDAEVLFTHRRAGGTEVYFVSNQKERAEDISAIFRVAGRAPELWDPATGGITRPGMFSIEGDRTAMPLRLEANGSVFVVFREPAPARHVVYIAAEQTSSVAVNRTAPISAAGVASAKETFTLSLWVKPEGDTPLPAERKQAVAFAGQNWAVHAQPGHLLFGEGHAGCGLGVGRNGVCVFEHSARYAPAVITHATEIKDWTHLALVYAAGTPRLFINGAEVRQGAKGPHVVHATAATTGPAFRGQRSAPQLFERALTAREVAALAANRPGAAAPAAPTLELERTADGKMFARYWTPGTRTVVFNDGRRVEIKASAAPDPVAVTGPWQVSFPPGLGAPATAKLDQLISWSEHATPGIRFFSGTATYEKEIEIPASLLGADHELYLDLGEVSVMAEIELNGRSLGIFWKPPFRPRVDGVAKAGANRLVVRVTNLWRNRMIGDAALPDDIEWSQQRRRGAYPAKWPDWLVEGKPRPSGRIAFCTRKDVYAKDDALLPSGLLGPVTLQTAELIPVKEF
ncbi:MAG: glycosyl hydrolase [Candidatus Sumerlaeota bacterium]|nr:glycosyl hydrolase [Candidatus Sumerlaeota bacterium]